MYKLYNKIIGLILRPAFIFLFLMLRRYIEIHRGLTFMESALNFFNNLNHKKMIYVLVIALILNI